MDADAARMLADLGNFRRDEIAAPFEGPADRPRGGRGQGRPAVPSADEQQTKQQEILQREENRRANAGKNERDANKATTLKLWNTKATFGSDDVAEQLENRFSGQGHRDRLAETMRIIRDREMDEGPYHQSGHQHGRQQMDDERRPPRGARSELQAGRGSHHQFNTPRATRPRAPSPRATRPRAPSPRAAGTRRFVNDRAVQRPQRSTFMPPPLDASSNFFGSSSQAAATATGLAHATPASITPAPATLEPSASPAPHVLAAAARRGSQVDAQAEAAASSVSSVPAVATPGTSNALAQVAAPRSRVLPPPSTESQKHGDRTPVASAAGSTGSLAATAVVTTASNILRNAWQSLGRSSSSTPTQSSTSPSVQIAALGDAQAGTQVANTQLAVQSAASPAPIASRRLPSAPPSYAALPTQTWRGENKPSVSKQIQLALADAATPEDAGAQYWPESSETRHLYEIARSRIAMDAILLMEFPDAPVTGAYFDMHRDRAWVRPHALDAINGRLTDVSADPMLAELVEAAREVLGVESGHNVDPASNQPAAVEAPARIVSMGVVTGPPTPPASHRNSPVGSFDGTNIAAIASTPAANRGMLNATIQDYEGNFHEMVQLAIPDPIQANVTIMARDPNYDATNPSVLTGMMDILSRRMRARQELGLRLNERGEWVN